MRIFKVLLNKVYLSDRVNSTYLLLCRLRLRLLRVLVPMYGLILILELNKKNFLLILNNPISLIKKYTNYFLLRNTLITNSLLVQAEGTESDLLFNIETFSILNSKKRNFYNFYSKNKYVQVYRIIRLLLGVIGRYIINTYYCITSVNLSVRVHSKLNFLFLIFYLCNMSCFNIKILTDVTASDWSTTFTKHKNIKTSVYILYYMFLSLNNFRFICKKPSNKFAQSTPTLTSLFFSAGWPEREAWDMFGIYFIGNRDHRRLLTDYGFSGFPLRKSFPATGFIELYYSDALSKIRYIPVSFRQEYRKFFFN